MSVWVKNERVKKEQVSSVRKILQAVGKEVYIENENLLDVVTAISGSGPAYIFYLAELCETSGVKLGLGRKLAKLIAHQTLSGSAKLLEKSLKSARTLRKEVTSKGGTTEAAFDTMNKSGFKKIFFSAIKSACKRAKELRMKNRVS